MFTNRTSKHYQRFIALMVIFSLMISFAPGLMTGTVSAAESEAPSIEGVPVTPLQQKLYDAVNQLVTDGLPAPTITFSTQSGVSEGFGAMGPPQMLSSVDQPASTTATTVLYFDGPQDAGYEVWPGLEIKTDLAGDGSGWFTSGVISQEDIYNGVISQDPDFWTYTTPGKEAREYTITETIEELPPAGALLSGMVAPNLLPLDSKENLLLSSALANTNEDILMGFTYTGPQIRYIFEQRAQACVWIPFLGKRCADLFYLKAGLELDWALGLRLPANVDLSQVADTTPTGSHFETSLTPQDWTAAQYEAFGVAPEPNSDDTTQGNEFVMRLNFFAGVQLEVFGADKCPFLNGCYKAIDFDASQSVTTPFGTGNPDPILPEITIPLLTIDPLGGLISASFNFTIQPSLSSSNITADWSAAAGSDCYEKGTLPYEEADQVVVISPVDGCFVNHPEPIQLKLENFRYYFNQFSIGFGVGVSYDVLDRWSGSYSKTVFTLDLSKITKSIGLFVGGHVQCDFLFNCARKGPDNVLELGSVDRDTTPPVITPTIAGTMGNNDWYTDDVSLSWSVMDPDSEIISSTGCVDETITSDQVEQSYRCAATSQGGTADVEVLIKRDATPPQITCPAAGPFLLNSVPPVIGPPAVADLSSGPEINTQTFTLDTSAAGSQTFDFTGSDLAGNSASQECSYDVFYATSGFLPPVEAMNTGRAGRTYPVKWQLTDFNNSFIGDLAAIASITVDPSSACSASDTTATNLVGFTSSESTWRYDSIANQYVYNWKTPSTPGCYILKLTLNSGQTETATFDLK